MHHIVVDGLHVWCGDQWLEDFDQAMKQYYKENMTKQNINFGQAIEAAKQGKRVARAGWNGKNMFVFQRPADELSAEMIVSKVKSLPYSVKNYYKSMFAWTQDEATDGNGPDKTLVKFTAYLCMKAADGSIVNGWLASQTDILAEDWTILD